MITDEEWKKAIDKAFFWMTKSQQEEYQLREKLEAGLTSLKDVKKSFNLFHRQTSLRIYFDKKFEEKIKAAIVERTELDEVHFEFRKILAKRFQENTHWSE